MYTLFLIILFIELTDHFPPLIGLNPPLKFNPERFVPEEGKELPPEPTAAFGFGRRYARN